MTPRKLFGWGLLALLVIGVGNFAIGNIQTKGSLGLIARGGAQTTEGVRQLIGRHVLFDALQGGAPPKTRLNAIASLQEMANGGKDPEAFRQLLQMLKDPDTESLQEKTHPVRDAAKNAVAAVGPLYPDILLDAAKDSDGAIRDQSREALKTIGAKMQNEMAARLGDNDLRAPLGDILAGIGPQTVALVTPYLSPAALDKLKDKPDDLTTAKLQLIEILGKYKVRPAAEAVLPFANDPEPNVRRGVLTALANIADPVGEPVLIAALRDANTDASARAASAATLGAFGTNEANNAMVAALSDFDLAVADAAASGLRLAATTHPQTAEPAIARALASTDPAVRARVAFATGGLPTTTLAQKARADADATVRANAVTSLGEILLQSGKTVSPAELTPLVASLQDTDGAVTDAAQRALVRIGASAVPALTALLSSTNDATAYYAVRTLAAIGQPAFTPVANAAQVGKPSARWAAVALGEIGDPRAVPVLESLKDAKDADTANAAQVALAKVKQG